MAHKKTFLMVAKNIWRYLWWKFNWNMHLKPCLQGGGKLYRKWWQIPGWWQIISWRRWWQASSTFIILSSKVSFQIKSTYEIRVHILYRFLNKKDWSNLKTFTSLVTLIVWKLWEQSNSWQMRLFSISHQFNPKSLESSF